ncbi:hypothetical protein B0H14DRAFT_3440764 [Mycena olivaceomarginata]|nr:hypothetical protein B0H14DRAFT_3440764 [Mycena olivaceomarginata]
MGWAYSSGATRWVLVPGTLIALSSILITVAAIVHHGRTLPAHAFDPSDPPASHMETGVGLNVVLGWVPDQGHALLRTDQDWNATFGVMILSLQKRSDVFRFVSCTESALPAPAPRCRLECLRMVRVRTFGAAALRI